MSTHDDHSFWSSFQLGARLSLHEAGIEDSSARQQVRIELLKQLRDGEISLADPEPRQPNDPVASSSAAVVNADRTVAGKVMKDYLAVIDETIRMTEELDAEDDTRPPK